MSPLILHVIGGHGVVRERQATEARRRDDGFDVASRQRLVQLPRMHHRDVRSVSVRRSKLVGRSLPKVNLLLVEILRKPANAGQQDAFVLTVEVKSQPNGRFDVATEQTRGVDSSESDAAGPVVTLQARLEEMREIVVSDVLQKLVGLRVSIRC